MTRKMEGVVIASAAAVIAFTAAPEAKAQNLENVYSQFELDLSFADSSDIESTLGNGEAEWELGRGAGIGLGYRITPNIRTDLMLHYRTFPVDSLTVGAVTGAGSGDLSLTSATINAYYDFTFGDTALRPFVGAGIGYGLANFESTAPGLAVDDEDWVLTWNVMAGASYDIGPNSAIYAGYRYLQTEDPSFGAVALGTSGTLDTQFQSHEAMLGLRIDF